MGRTKQLSKDAQVNPKTPIHEKRAAYQKRAALGHQMGRLSMPKQRRLDQTKDALTRTKEQRLRIDQGQNRAAEQRCLSQTKDAFPREEGRRWYLKWPKK